MKKILTCLMLLGLCSATLFGQSKSELKEQLDSANKKNAALKKELDSVSTYTILYSEVREKIIHKEFNPADFPMLLDSLLARRDSNSLSMKLLNDSLAKLHALDKSQNEEISKLKYFVEQFGGKPVTLLEPKDMMGTWSLSLLSVRLMGDTMRNGLVQDDSVNADKIVRINLVDNEFAIVDFAHGKNIKCFYKINSFSSTAPFYIDLSKGDELNVRLYVAHTATGMKVSYKGEKNSFLYGSMKRM